MTAAERIRAANDILMRGAFRRYMREHELLMDEARAPVPADARERTWTKISTALSEGAFSAQPQPEDGYIAGSAVARPTPVLTAQTPSLGGRCSPTEALEGAR